MRYFIITTLVIALTACQTTTDSTASKTSETVSSDQKPTAPGKYQEETDPLRLAKKLTYSLETAHNLTSGTFTTFDPKTLEELKTASVRFDRPGISLPYIKYMREIQDINAKKSLESRFEKLKNDPNMRRHHVVLLEKIYNRILNFTLSEEELASSCMAEYTWSYLRPGQQLIYDKMALGTDVTTEELKKLKIRATHKSAENMTIKCTLEPLGLYEEYIEIFYP